MATFASLSAILLNDRTDMVIRNLLQTDIACWAKMPVKNRTWDGDVAIIGLRTSRNNSVRSVNGNTEPVPGEQGFLRLTVRSKRVLGVASFDLDALLSATSSKGSQAIEPMDELDGLLDDFKKQLSFYVFNGGGGLQALGTTVTESPIGVVWQRQAVGVTYGYTGRFQDILAAAPQAVNQVIFRRLDTLAQVGTAQLLTGMTSNTITLAANIDTLTGLTAATGGFGVYLVGAGSQVFNDFRITGDNGANGAVALAVAPAGTVIGQFQSDMTGILANMTQSTHFGLDRTSTSTLVGIDRVRSNFLICNDTNAQGGSALTGGQVDKLINRVRKNGGGKIDAMWCGFDTLQAFSEAMQGVADANMRVDASGGAKKLDGGAPAVQENDEYKTDLSRGGIPFCVSDQCPEGAIFGVKYKAWERLFKGPQEGMWLCGDGPGGKTPLIKAPGMSEWTATRAMLPEQVLTAPKLQVMMSGIAPP